MSLISTIFSTSPLRNGVNVSKMNTLTIFPQNTLTSFRTFYLPLTGHVKFTALCRIILFFSNWNIVSIWDMQNDLVNKIPFFIIYLKCPYSVKWEFDFGFRI